MSIIAAMLDLSAIVAGILLGLSLGVPPGPVNAAIAAESVKKSYASGILVGLGAMTSDFCYLLLTVIGVSVLLTGATARTIISVVGGLILLYFAVTTLKNYRSPPQEDEGKMMGNPYVKGLVMAITNPMGIVWRATAGAAFVELFNIFGVAGFMLGLFAWIASLSLAVHFAKSRFTAVYPIIMLASGLCMLAFGAMLLYDVIAPALGL
jgi:threonine/homoserine/homoserine lactone efflux protein